MLVAAEAAEEEEVRQQTDNGRYICIFPGCGKTFASRGKRMRDHEATHNQQVPPHDSQGLLFPCDSAPSEKVPEKDNMFNHQCSFLEYGMLILNFFDAIKEGGGKRFLKKNLQFGTPWSLMMFTIIYCLKRLAITLLMFTSSLPD